MHQENYPIQDKASAFEQFKLEYSENAFLESQKVLLKSKYMEAKECGEKANLLRNNISIYKRII